MTRNERLKELVELGGKIPQGKWGQSHRKDTDDMYSTQAYTEKDGETICTFHWYQKPPRIDEFGRKWIGTYREENAQFLVASANARQDLADVLAENERLKKNNKKLNWSLADMVQSYDVLVDEIKSKDERVMIPFTCTGTIDNARITLTTTEEG